MRFLLSFLYISHCFCWYFVVYSVHFLYAISNRTRYKYVNQVNPAAQNLPSPLEHISCAMLMSDLANPLYIICLLQEHTTAVLCCECLYLCANKNAFLL